MKLTLAHKLGVVATAGAMLAFAGCERGSQMKADDGPTSTVEGTCPEIVTAAEAAVTKALDVRAPWTGPTSGPKASGSKSIIYIAQAMTNPGVAGVAKGVQEAGAAIGWNVRVLDGGGNQSDIGGAIAQAIAQKPDGIVLSGFDPKTVSGEVSRANSAGIPLVGWHAVASPGPSDSPKLFSNVTTRVEDVSEISAQYIVAKSKGTAGVVIFTDDSIPFAAGKAQMIEDGLKKCNSVSVLSKQNIPIPDAGTRTPQAFSTLVTSLGDKWTYSVAINDLYFDNAATPLRAAGKQGGGAPYNVGAGDGSEAAFQRIAAKQFQAATVPEPLNEQGWQIVDEFNRAFAKEPASMYVSPVHITDFSNVGTSTIWDPQNGYRDEYKKIWGK